MAIALSVARVPDRLSVVLVLTPLLLLSPWMDATLSRMVDRVFLKRRYSPGEAERFVLKEFQLAVTEEDLRGRAEKSLSDIFACTAEVAFAWPPRQPADGDLAATLPVLQELVH